MRSYTKYLLKIKCDVCSLTQREMNVCGGQEGIAEAVRIVDNYVKTVERGLDNICTRDKLDLFFRENYRTHHKNILLNFLKKCASVYALIISINEESLLALYSVTASVLAQFLEDCLDDVLLKQRKLSVPLKTTLDLRQSNNVVITWTLSINEKNLLVKKGTTTVTASVSSFKSQIAAYESMRSATRNDIVRFLERTPSVKEHLGVEYCQERLQDIFVWLHNALIKHHLIVYIDVEEPNLVRQLLCHHTLSVKSILSSLIKTDYFITDPELPCFAKKIVSFKSLTLPLSSPAIQIYADTIDTFWVDGGGDDKYARLIKEHSNEVNYLVDVHQAWHEGRLRTVSLLERSPPEKQTALYESFEQLDEVRRRKAYVELRNNKETVYVERTIESSLASVPERLTYKGNYRIEHGTQATLTELVLNSCTKIGGVKDSCDMLQDCIDTTISKANTLTEERDLDSFNGDIVISTHKMSANSFDMKRKLLWTPTENSVMEDERNHSYVRECLEQRLCVNTLKLAYGDDEVSHCVIPCVMDRNHYTMNNIITTNTINNNKNNKNKNSVNFNVALTTALLPDPNQQVEALSTTTKKRKIPDEVLQERIKRIRLIKDVTAKGEDKESGLVYQLVHTKGANPVSEAFKECIVCERQKPYSSFYIKKKQIEKNICCTCLTKESKLRNRESMSI